MQVERLGIEGDEAEYADHIELTITPPSDVREYQGFCVSRPLISCCFTDIAVLKGEYITGSV